MKIFTPHSVFRYFLGCCNSNSLYRIDWQIAGLPQWFILFLTIHFCQDLSKLSRKLLIRSIIIWNVNLNFNFVIILWFFFKSLGWKLFKRRWSILSRKMEVIKASKLICIITLGASSSEILHMCGPHPDAPCVEQHLLVIIHEKHSEWPKLLSLSLTSYLLSGLPIN